MGVTPINVVLVAALFGLCVLAFAEGQVLEGGAALAGTIVAGFIMWVQERARRR